MHRSLYMDLTHLPCHSSSRVWLVFDICRWDSLCLETQGDRSTDPFSSEPIFLHRILWDCDFGSFCIRIQYCRRYLCYDSPSGAWSLTYLIISVILFRTSTRYPFYLAVQILNSPIKYLTSYIPWFKVVCKKSHFNHWLMLMLYILNDLALQVLRVYAISGRRWQFALLVGTFNVAIIVITTVRTLSAPNVAYVTDNRYSRMLSIVRMG